MILNVKIDKFTECINLDSDYYKWLAEYYYWKFSSYSSCIYWLLGPKGTWKSSMLQSVKQYSQSVNGSDVWLVFDAWQFPQRKEL